MDDIAALLEALVGKSLVRIEDGFDGEPRFAMLETIREYTQERLVHSDEYDLIHEQLVTFFVTMAEAAAPHLEGCEQHMWIERLGHDYENLYTALQWCRSSAERAELGLRLVTALGRFWNLRGHRRAARDWCRNFLGQLSPTPPSLHHARALAFAAELESPDDLDRAERWLLQSLEIAHALGDTRSAAVALHGLGGVAHERSDLSGAQAHYEESLALLEQSAAGPEETVYLRFNIGQIARDLGELDRARAHMEASLGIMRQLGDLTGIGAMLQILAYMSRDSGNAQQAGAQLQESLGIWKKLDNRLAMATILSDLADLARDQGDLAQAVACYQQCLQVVHTLPDAFDRAWPLRHFGYVTYLQGNAERAMALVQESLTLFVKQADREGLASCLELMAALWADEQPEQAARLWGMGAMLRTTIEMPLPSSEQILREQRTAVAQARLGSRTFEVAWSAGQQLSLDQAIAEALDGCIN
jgi:tetratricopeptide (TPR) repeat protein